MNVRAGELHFAQRFLATHTSRAAHVTSWSDWTTFRATSESPQWVYIYAFTARKFAWGTTAGKSDRLRRACMFNEQLTGKYDRRVDYLMLKVLHGMPSVTVFECRPDDEATDIEGLLREQFRQHHCYRGFEGATRRDISEEIHAAFRRSAHYRALPATTRRDFETFMAKVFYAHRRHPKNPKRTFFWGDCLEPRFLRTLGLGHLEAAVEAALRVRFPPPRRAR